MDLIDQQLSIWDANLRPLSAGTDTYVCNENFELCSLQRDHCPQVIYHDGHAPTQLYA